MRLKDNVCSSNSILGLLGKLFGGYFCAMIFGFNTDIKQDENTYHVQSEARIGEQLLQTQVFVQGRCIVKRAVSYSDRAEDPAFTEEVMHETLRQQHRWVVDAIRDGYLDELVIGAEDAERVEQPLAVRFVSSARPSADSIVLCFQLTLGGAPVAGIDVHAHLVPERAANEMSVTGASVSAVTRSDGTAEINLPVPPGANGEATLVVQATHESQKMIKKFRLKTTSGK